MPHISKKKLKKQVFQKIQEEFIDVLANIKSTKEGKQFIRELFTQTEQVMLAKRLAILFMLQKGYSFHMIERTLKVTPQTILRFWKNNKQKQKQIVTHKVFSERVQRNFWEDVEALLLMGMPSRGRR